MFYKISPIFWFVSLFIPPLQPFRYHTLYPWRGHVCPSSTISQACWCKLLDRCNRILWVRPACLQKKKERKEKTIRPGTKKKSKNKTKQDPCSTGPTDRFFPICWFFSSFLTNFVNQLICGPKFQWKIARKASKKNQDFKTFFSGNFGKKKMFKKIVLPNWPLFGISSPVEHFFSWLNY